MNTKKHTGLTRLIKAITYSLSGLRSAFTNEAAFRQELLLAIILIPIAIWWGEAGIEQVLLIGSIMLVLIAELLNSAVEAVVDRVGEEYHDLSGRAKDLGSAAVFVALLNVVVIWALILGNKLLQSKHF